MNYLKEYFVALIVFFTVDLVWLVVIAKDLYQKYIGFLLADNPNWVAAIVFYLLYIIGLVFFVINPAIEKRSFAYALFAGMFFGFITYATYDLTNLATTKDWPLNITIIDLIWGSTLGGSVSAITYTILTKLNWIQL